MSKYRIFFTGDDGDWCAAEDIEEIVDDTCENPATYFAEDEDGVQTMLCETHKDALKAAIA